MMCNADNDDQSGCEEGMVVPGGSAIVEVDQRIIKLRGGGEARLAKSQSSGLMRQI